MGTGNTKNQLERIQLGLNNKRPVEYRTQTANLEKRSGRLKAFHRKARFESICLVGFLPLNVLYNPRITQQQRSEDQMDRVAPLLALAPHNSSNKPFYFIQPLLKYILSVSIGQANVSFPIGRKGISWHDGHSMLFQQFQSEIHRA